MIPAPAMKTRLFDLALLLIVTLTGTFAVASAYDGRPKLVVIVFVDGMRADALEAQKETFTGGFRTLLDRGAVFTECRYEYANTWTSAGHSTVLTGTNPVNHGIGANYWWDPQRRTVVDSAQDPATRVVGLAKGGLGASPRNLLTTTLGDQLKLATAGQSRVFSIALKDTASALSGGHSADAAFWIDRPSGLWVTSTYYRAELPAWVAEFNRTRTPSYWDREWKDETGKVLRDTRRSGRTDGQSRFYDVVGQTALGVEYEFEFARALVQNEKLGSGPATDLLILSLSPNDLLEHKIGPQTPEVAALARATDRMLGDFFSFLGQQVGLANVWIAFTADHGFEPHPDYPKRFRLDSLVLPERDRLGEQLSAALSTRLGKPAKYVPLFRDRMAFLAPEAFAAVGIKTQADAERLVGEELMKAVPGLRGYFTRSQLATGSLRPGLLSKLFVNSFLEYGGWYVIAVSPPFGAAEVGIDADHGTPYDYDREVPLILYGLPFLGGTYRAPVQPIDLAPTLADLLGISPPALSTGRVLTEGLVKREPPAGR